MCRCHVSGLLRGASPLERTTATRGGPRELAAAAKAAAWERICGSRKDRWSRKGLAAAAKVAASEPALAAAAKVAAPNRDLRQPGLVAAAEASESGRDLRQPQRSQSRDGTCGSHKGHRVGAGLAAATKVSEWGPDLRQPQRSPGLFQLSGT